MANCITDKLQSNSLDEFHTRLLDPISKNRIESNPSLEFFYLAIWNYLEISARNADLEKASILR